MEVDDNWKPAKCAYFKRIKLGIVIPIPFYDIPLYTVHWDVIEGYCAKRVMSKDDIT